MSRKITEDELARGKRIEEARQLAVAAPVLLPLLQKYREDAISAVQSKVRDSALGELAGPATQLYVIDNLIQDIKTKLENLNGG